MSCNRHRGFELVTVHDKSAMTKLSNLSEASPDSHAYVNIRCLTVDDLCGQPGTFIELNLSDNVGRLRFEVIRGLPHYCESMDYPKSLELVLL